MRLPFALLFAALLPGAAMAQAMLEAGTITGQSSTAGRPDWAQGDDVPAPRSTGSNGSQGGLADRFRDGREQLDDVYDCFLRGLSFSGEALL